MVEFHEGEIAVQVKAGTRGVAEELKRGISDRIDLEFGRNEFFRDLRMVYVAAVDGDGDVWVSEASGEKGFFQAPDPTTLQVDVSNDHLVRGDPVREIFEEQSDTQIGVLAIDFDKRRRYRTNGRFLATESSNGKVAVRVAEAFPNCPKYIQRRSIVGRRATSSSEAIAGVELPKEAIAMIQKADTLIFGTRNPETGADINLRGGNPGFVRVPSSSEIMWPEYRGNGMFNSSGNLEVDHHAGLLFIDYEGSGNILQVVGEAHSDWDPQETLEGSTRAIRFKVKKFRLYTGSEPYEWKLNAVSDYNPTIAGHDQSEDRAGPFPVQVKMVKVVKESDSVSTFRFLAPRPVKFLPGQYASFDFHVAELGDFTRTWTLSETANSATRGDVTMEISVKRKPGGVISNWLHDKAELGMEVTLTGIGGDLSPFIDEDEVPKKIALLSGGVGITPMMAILRGLRAFRNDADVVFTHSERHEKDRPFGGELDRRGSTDEHLRLIRTVTDSTETLIDNRVRGRITKQLLEPELGDDPTSWTVYLCGPDRFMVEVSKALLEIGIPSKNLNTEAFNF
ncbi:hypothetical protein NDN08_000767 [Rhodosorus marinus]|uniref:FAD-binding FR-type domain-containing protein n=1 Tax=Rhodosorus marinus TaxID=101924 RepID=A0AAV8URQ3_9RHOD|nr:hypothetical protein NDN08_000767 [Rhodosorus marinus]